MTLKEIPIKFSTVEKNRVETFVFLSLRASEAIELSSFLLTITKALETFSKASLAKKLSKIFEMVQNMQLTSKIDFTCQS